MDLNRKTAFQVLFEIEKEDSYSNLTLNKFISENKPENPAFVRELVYGVLENKMLLDYYLNQLIPSGINKVKKKEKCFLRMGLYQILFMDSVPEYAAINETVNLAKKLCRGRETFINGVLRGYLKKKDGIKLPDDEKEALSIRYSFPIWIIDMWTMQYGEEKCEALLKASNERPHLSIRVNLMKKTPEMLKSRLESKGFKVASGKHSKRILYVEGSGLLDTDEYKQGMFSVQDEASALAADALDPEEGYFVIDVCAAPGGKSLAIAEAMNDKGQLYSCDIYEHKLKLISEQANRLGVSIVKPTLLDGIVGDTSLNGLADRVLVDAPCSGLGVIRRKPEIKYKENEDLRELVSIQAGILERASKYLKDNGVLVYSTCTVNKDENENQVRTFLKKNNNFELVEERQFLPTEGLDGFYVCKMIKRSN
ncbi:MAG: 16S rRNA (cytosine(967)-C(5))-methyltransferase RsmB [Firmicutes bacterium]|nr:16S rRNA (cytosine(967)-C(5))-methyltransferase RsmB [Bacillota bacterium]